jgi:hypothetical protein
MGGFSFFEVASDFGFRDALVGFAGFKETLLVGCERIVE